MNKRKFTHEELKIIIAMSTGLISIIGSIVIMIINQGIEL